MATDGSGSAGAGAAGAGSWGLELWDQEKAIFEAVDGRLRLLRSCKHFVHARASLEQAYARDLQKLVKSHLAECEHPDCGDESSTLLQAWRSTLQETEALAKQREVVAENLNTEVADRLKDLFQTCRNNRKAAEAELQKQQRTLNTARSRYEAARKAHDKACREVADGKTRHEKAQKEGNKQKIDKTKTELDKLTADCERLKADYIVVMAQFNQAQREYYTRDQLRIFNEMQAQAEERTQHHRSCLQAYARIDREVLPIVTKCLDAMDGSTAYVDAADDTRRFVRRIKTGLPMPSDEVAGDQTAAPVTTTYSVQKVHQRRVLKTKLFKTTSRKKDAIRDDFGHLPPEQRKNAIHKKVEELTVEHAKVNKTIQACSKTVQLYREKPEFGDEKTIAKAEKELVDLNKQLEKLANELFKFQLYLSAIEGTPPSAPPEGYKADTASHASFDDDNFSIDSSGGAAYGVLETSGTPPPGARAEAADADSFDEFSDEDESSTDPAVAAAAATASPARAQTGGSSLARVESPVVATAAAPAVPKAQMLYAFAGTNPGELAAEEGDEVEILLDDDSGWVHARKGAVEGYVPRSYLNL